MCVRNLSFRHKKVTQSSVMSSTSDKRIIPMQSAVFTPTSNRFRWQRAFSGQAQPDSVGNEPSSPRPIPRTGWTFATRSVGDPDSKGNMPPGRFRFPAQPSFGFRAYLL